MTRHIGGSILPSGSPEIYRPKVGKYGTFETRPLADLDTHGLFYTRLEGPHAGVAILIASHPNGYSCNVLAERLLSAWDGKLSKSRALEQFDYILSCGGIGKARDTIDAIGDGAF